MGRGGTGPGSQGCQLQVIIQLLSSILHANPRVLPKLTCRHCGKTFSRKSTLDQHLVSHSSERWADVQVWQPGV